MKPYLHELVKMTALAATVGLLAAHWTSALTAVTVSAAALWLLLGRAG